jgi:hypothetical protein
VSDSRGECSVGSPYPHPGPPEYFLNYVFAVPDKEHASIVEFTGSDGPLERVTGLEILGKFPRDVIIPSLASVQ